MAVSPWPAGLQQLHTPPTGRLACFIFCEPAKAIIIITKVAFHGVPAGLDPVLDASLSRKPSSSSPRLSPSLSFRGIAVSGSYLPIPYPPSWTAQPLSSASGSNVTTHARAPRQILLTTDSSWPRLGIQTLLLYLVIRSAVLAAALA